MPALQRYAAFLRGVSPMNAKMSELKRCFESAGFTEVKTVLASGNVVFNAPRASESTLERKIQAAMRAKLKREFFTIVRSITALEAVLAADPYAAFKVPANAKRVVTFLHQEPQAKLKLPIELDGTRILKLQNREVFTTYLPNPRGPVFMQLIQKTFGDEVTTRTWDTIKKVTAA